MATTVQGAAAGSGAVRGGGPGAGGGRPFGRPMDAKQKALLEGPIGKALLMLSVPIILGNLLQTGYQLTDAFWVGRLGADAVAAVAVSFPLTFLVIGLGSGLAMAGATLSAQYMGAGRRDMVNHVAAQTMVMTAGTSAVLGTIGFLLAPYVLHAMHVTPAVYAGALGFLRTSFVGVPFVFGYMMFAALMRGVGQVKIPLYITLGTVLLNFVLDPFFIFGWGGLPPQGVMGAAMATLVTQAIAFGIGIAIFLRGRHGIELAWADFKPDPDYVKRAFKLGLPGSIEMSTRSLGLMVMTFVVTQFGTLTTATFGVGSNVIQITIILAMGVAMAQATLVGQNMGAGNVERAGRVTWMSAAIVFALLEIAGVLAWIFAPYIVRFFVPNDAAVVASASHYIRINCLSWGGFGVVFVISSAFRACGRMTDAMRIAIISQWGMQFPLAYGLSRFTSLHAEGLWWAFPITNTIAPVMACLWFARGGWKTGNLVGGETRAAAVTDLKTVEIEAGLPAKTEM